MIRISGPIMICCDCLRLKTSIPTSWRSGSRDILIFVVDDYSFVGFRPRATRTRVFPPAIPRVSSARGIVSRTFTGRESPACSVRSRNSRASASALSGCLPAAVGMWPDRKGSSGYPGARRPAWLGASPASTSNKSIACESRPLGLIGSRQPAHRGQHGRMVVAELRSQLGTVFS